MLDDDFPEIPSKDETLRITCLNLALESRADANVQKTVERAAAFEAYILHGDTKFYSEEQVREIDRNARAFGWEVGMKALRKVPEEPLNVRTDNPFTQPDYQSQFGDVRATLG